MNRVFRTLWTVAAILIAAGVAWILAETWTQHEIAVARQALDIRAAELTQRALTPGSPFACLDAVANAAVEAACEKALFATAETTASAVAYVDAELNLLLDGLAHVTRDPGYAGRFNRLRLGLEADRFGMVAQALVSRGCTAERCAALTLFHNPQRIVANLKERTFDANVALHAAAWGPSNATAATTPGAPTTYSVSSATSSPVPTNGLTPGAPSPGKFEFPSASSIPPVSIMNAEPPLTKAEEAAIAPAAPPPAQTPPARRTPSRAPAQNVPLPPPAPGAPPAAVR